MIWRSVTRGGRSQKTSIMKYRIARYILFVGSTLILIYGVIILFLPSFILDNLELYANVELKELQEEQQKMAEWLVMAMQLLGCFNIIAGLVGQIAIYKSFKIKGKWLLLIIFISAVLGYIAPISFDLRTGVVRWMEVIELITFGLTLVAFVILLAEPYQDEGSPI